MFNRRFLVFVIISSISAIIIGYFYNNGTSDIVQYLPDFMQTSVGVDHNVEVLHRRNIILITVEELGFSDVGFHGSTDIRTPNIDALAYSGFILNNYYVQPSASLSMYALLTGQFPIHTGMTETANLNESKLLDSGLDESRGKNLQQYLKKLGYINHLAGKWYLGHDHLSERPLYRGYDTHLGYLGGNHDYYDHVNLESKYFRSGMLRNDKIAPDLHGKHAIDIFTDEAVTIIKNHDTQKPLFLHVAHGAVHPGSAYNTLPVTEEESDEYRYIKDTRRRRYAAMVTKVDTSVGEIVYALYIKGILNESIIIFTPLVGTEQVTPDSIGLSNYPFRGGKGSLLAGGLRAAAFYWSSDHLLQGGKVINELIHINDWWATLTLQDNRPLPKVIDEKEKKDYGENKDGNMTLYDPQLYSINITTVFNGGKSERTRIVHNSPDMGRPSLKAAVLNKQWKLVADAMHQSNQPTQIPKIPINITKSLDINYQRSVLDSMAAKALGHIDYKLDKDKILKIRSNATIHCSTQFKNLVACTRNRPCIFNLKSDPCERNNLGGLDASREKDLNKILEMARKELKLRFDEINEQPFYKFYRINSPSLYYFVQNNIGYVAAFLLLFLISVAYIYPTLKRWFIAVKHILSRIYRRYRPQRN